MVCVADSMIMKCGRKGRDNRCGFEGGGDGERGVVEGREGQSDVAFNGGNEGGREGWGKEECGEGEREREGGRDGCGC